MPRSEDGSWNIRDRNWRFACRESPFAEPSGQIGISRCTLWQSSVSFVAKRSEIRPDVGTSRAAPWRGVSEAGISHAAMKPGPFQRGKRRSAFADRKPKIGVQFVPSPQHVDLQKHAKATNEQRTSVNSVSELRALCGQKIAGRSRSADAHQLTQSRANRRVAREVEDAAHL